MVDRSTLYPQGLQFTIIERLGPVRCQRIGFFAPGDRNLIKAQSFREVQINCRCGIYITSTRDQFDFLDLDAVEPVMKRVTRFTPADLTIRTAF